MEKKYLVILDEYNGPYGSAVYANSVDHAAETFGVKYNEEGRLINDEIDVIVVEPDGTRHGRRIAAIPTIDYEVQEIPVFEIHST